MVLEVVGGSWRLVVLSVGGPQWDGAGQVEGGRLGSAWWREIVRI
jgi:hypothetical protein